MKIAFVLPIRDKERWVREAVRSALAQTFSPMEIVLSDQCSTDATGDIIRQEARRYGGPNKVSLLRCDVTGFHGNDGLNTHLNWLHHQVEADFIVMGTGDDVHHPERVERTVNAWRESGAAYVSTALRQVDGDGTVLREMTAGRTGPRTPLACVRHNPGVMATSAWEPALMDRFGPLEVGCVQDILMPFWAALDKGFFYLDETLHDLRLADNTGAGSRCDTAPEAEKPALYELMQYERTATAVAMHRAALAADAPRTLLAKLLEEIGGRSLQWTQARAYLGFHNLQPVNR